MHDKTIRRRRAVLALLVVVSLILLTDYFGESSNSPLHSIQRGIVAVLSPIQEGASRVLSPVRDVAGYFSSTFQAKSDVAKYKSENAKLAQELATAQYNATGFERDQGLLKLGKDDSLSSYGPVSAYVDGEDPSVWYDTITIDRGSSSGVRQYDPVVGPGGLVGDVSQVNSGDSSTVTLLTSPHFAVGAMVENGAPENFGTLQPAVGDLGSLTLLDLPSTTQVSNGQEVVTSGYVDAQDPTIESFAPPGILIGTVADPGAQNSFITNQQVSVTPTADLTQLSVVRVLTDPHPHL